MSKTYKKGLTYARGSEFGMISNRNHVIPSKKQRHENPKKQRQAWKNERW